MPTQCITIDLADQGRRKVRAGFDGGRMSCDGGALLLRAIDQRIGLTRRLAACFVDHRDPRRCEHSLQRLLAQRLFGLALGYEDISDHDRLRDDSLLALALGSDDLSGERRVRERDRGHPLAGSSTLNRLELGTPEQARQDRYKRIVADTERIVGQIRQRWPRVRVVVRGDAGFCRDDLMAWCEGQEGLDYVFGLAKNPRLKRAIERQQRRSRSRGLARTGLAAVPRFPLPDADELEPEAARGGQGRVGRSLDKPDSSATGNRRCFETIDTNRPASGDRCYRSMNEAVDRHHYLGYKRPIGAHSLFHPRQAGKKTGVPAVFLCKILALP